MHRPLIQNKLSVLSQAGLAKDDFSSAESAVLTAKVSKDFTIIIGPLLKLVAYSMCDRLNNINSRESL